ncbi:MAG TPA: lipopolysaccharide heptosyltransferase II [Burkholderiales bacterium]|nr:lipopolysaccharide heptosyltransferase II [Burkholderiales bacterium]
MPRILIVAPNGIGDALMTQPLLARLRAKLPHARLDVLAPAWVAPVLRRMPEVDEVIESPWGRGGLALGARWRLGRMLRARGYDQAIVLPNTWKSALAPFFADIAVRSGYVGESRYGLLNLLYRAPGGKRQREPMARHYARLAEPPGSDPREPLPEPRLRVDAAAAALTARRFGFGEAPRRNAILCPGAEFGPAKRWPAEHYAALAKALAARGIDVWLLGSASDTPVCEAVAQAAAGAARSLAGRTTLDEAIELIGRADFVVSNDSGLMHVAAALERPQVALFGSSSPAHTPPLSQCARALWLGIECSPCFARECPLGHFRCMRELLPARVLAELGELGVLPSAPVT